MGSKENNGTSLHVALTAELARFVRNKVERGLYSSASEVVREALRLLARTETDVFDRDRVRRAVQGIRATRKGMTLGDDLSIREMIDEGRL